MAADPELVEATNKAMSAIVTAALPIILVGGVAGILLSLVRRNTDETLNRFFYRLNKTKKKCPRDGGTLIKRRGKYGPFLGCSNYPKCQYTEGGKI